MTNHSSYESNGLDTLWDFVPRIAKFFSLITLVFTLIQMGALAFGGPAATLSVDGSKWINSYNATTGNADSKVKVVYFYDLQCPACKSNDPELEKTVEATKDKVQFIYRNLPLEIHPYAQVSARGAQAMLRQGVDKYFEYKKQIFARQSDLSPTVVEQVGKSLAPDYEKWNQDRNSKEVRDEVLADKQFAERQTMPALARNNNSTSIGSTPTTVVIKDDKVVDWWSGGLESASQIASITAQLE
jgi:protein-disulfide isomerase